MKKIILKISILAMLIVILFANVSFADEKTEVLNKLFGILNNDQAMSDGTAAIFLSETLSSDTEKRAIWELSSKVLNDLKGAGITLYYGRDSNGSPYIAALYQGAEGKVGPIEIVSERDNSFGAVDNDGVRFNNQKKFYGANNRELVGISKGQSVELDAEKSYIFALNEDNSTIKGTKLRGKLEDGTYIQVENQATVENTKHDSIVNHWSDGKDNSTDVALNDSNTDITISSGKRRYYFDVPKDGTYEVFITQNDGSKTEYHDGIFFTDKQSNNIMPVLGGAFETEGMDGNASKNVVLTAEDLYYWDFDINDNITITYKFLHSGIVNLNSTEYVSSNLAKKNDDDVAHGAEALITRLFLAIGDVFMWAIRGALGSDLSIDNLVFNRYEGTKISFFGGQTSVLNNALIKVVNYWYKALSNFTFVLYIIILVYIGIMIVATSGTPRQDKAKAYFGDWIVGLFILMFLPYYGFPFLFRINDALVEYVGRNSQTFQTYYNLEEKYETTEEIKGGDSYTILVEKIEGELAKANEQKAKADEEVKQALIDSAQDTVSEIANRIYKKMENERLGQTLQDYEYDNITKASSYLKKEIIDKMADEYYLARRNGKTSKQAENEIKEMLKHVEIPNNIGATERLNEMLENFTEEELSAIVEKFDRAYEASNLVEETEQDLESISKDIMGTMRELAGKTLRLVYAIIWLMLIFQLIGLTILYYKRIFTIALLIAIFPIVMLTYCIDKMADGAAQTFSAWMKELLSNIFIQTVHAIIYAVLIDMGLQIYEGGETGWLFLVGAMFLLLPAESIFKEIFDLNGSTLSQVGGTFTKFAMGAGALVSLARAGKSEKDKSIKTANDNRMKRLQNSQNRADIKAKQREFRSTYQLDKSRYGGIKGKATLVGDRFKGRDNVKYTAKPGGKPNAMREKMYHGATAARKAYAKAAPKAGRVIRGVRNASAITVGALYAASGGDVQSLAQGAAIAKGLSGKTSDGKKKADLKTELKSAYKRQK